MTENEVSRIVVDAAIRVHTVLGPGLLESVYEAALAFELEKRGLRVARQVPIPVRYEEVVLDEGFRADLIVEGIVVVELKAIETLGQVHKRQLFTYLKLSGARVGLLLNFGAAYMKDGIVRVANGAPD